MADATGPPSVSPGEADPPAGQPTSQPVHCPKSDSPAARNQAKTKAQLPSGHKLGFSSPGKSHRVSKTGKSHRVNKTGKSHSIIKTVELRVEESSGGSASVSYCIRTDDVEEARRAEEALHKGESSSFQQILTAVVEL